MSYTRVTEIERSQIYVLWKAEKGNNEIARMIGRDKGTVSREVRLDAEEKLRKGWTPEIICGRAELEGLPHVCKETVYKHGYADARAGGDLWANLPSAKRRRKRRCPRQDGRGRGMIPGRREIETRPPEVGLQVTVGHWEGDLVVGASATGYLVTLVERETNENTNGLIRRPPLAPIAFRCSLFVRF